MKLVRKYIKPISLFCAFTFIFELFAPTTVYAITGHDSMPEYRSFEPVGTTNMVNHFDGSFTYNIPIMEVPNGYPINMSYHSSEVNNESLASWVGLGWSLNPGAINRIKRGVPDEFKGETVTYWNRMPANWTISAGLGAQPELFGEEELLTLNVGAAVTYNNYNGIGTSVNAGLGFAGVANLDFSYSQGKYGFNPSINPFELLNVGSKFQNRKNRKTNEQSLGLSGKAKRQHRRAASAKRSFLSMQQQRMSKTKGKSSLRPQVGMAFGGFSASSRSGNYFTARLNTPQSYPVSISQYYGQMISIRLDAGVNLVSLPIDIEGSLMGSYNIQTNVSSTIIPVYGYKHSDVAITNSAGMMDYSTENEKLFEKRDNMLGYPLPNNDVYSLSGEGLGGTFRPFRSEYGHYRKNLIRSEDVSLNVGADVNLASIISVIPPPPVGIVNTEYTLGAKVGADYHWTTIGTWSNLGDAANYQFQSESAYDTEEKYFFRFSNDKAGYFDLSDEPASATPWTASSYGIGSTVQYNGRDYISLSGNNNTTPKSPSWAMAVDLPFTADLNPGLLNASLSFSNWTGNNQLVDYRSEGKHKKRSTYILEHLNSDFGLKSTVDGTDYKYKVFEKNTELVDLTGSSVTDYDHSAYNASGSGEMVTYNNDGVAYVYGLPVYARNEKNLQYSLKSTDYTGLDDATGGGIMANVVNNVDVSADRKLGFESESPYATTHLLTQILSADYVDRTANGPTKDDFGSFTKFNYYKVHGGTPGGNDWYPFRTPYEKVSFNIGSLSDRKDDMGSLSYGEKEVYLLHSIVSKTHVAIFTLEDREDGLSANLVNTPTANDIIKGSSPSAVPAKLKKLTRIDLYPLDNCHEATGSVGEVWEPNTGAIPIQTVHFDYSYELCAVVPNNSGTITSKAHPLRPGVNENAQRGKLTLHKIWFEFGGKLTSKISPYMFHYEYAQSVNNTQLSYIDEYPAPYNGDVYDPASNPTGIQNYGHATTIDEQPNYNPVNSDRWGNYRDYPTMLASGGANNLGDLARFWPFVHQNPDASVYDPASWSLKRIVLPSGGEIHVQYEQSDYHHVQDKRAMVMVPLKGNTSDDETNGGIKDKKYYLDLDKIGVDFSSLTTASDKEVFVRDLFEPMDKEKQRIFFNFLYALVGETPNYRNTNTDYLEGFARITGYGYIENDPAPDEVFFLFKGDGNSGSTYYKEIEYATKVSKRELPRKVCREFYKSQRRGIADGDPNATAALNSAGDGGGTGEELVTAFVNLTDNFDELISTKCKEFDPEMSYVRVQMPVIKPKLGGGFRVKRLLMYDPGMVSGDPRSLYGQEYTYTTNLNTGDPSSPIISSGVAANEPGNGRRENALVNPIEKDAQSKLNALAFGRDMYGQEGPLGESLLPGASVGYSKVNVTTIHAGLTGTGSEVHEFYTVKDFPFEASKTILKQSLVRPKSISLSIAGISMSYTRKAPHLAQGYSFKSYGMHGQPKRITKYAQGLPDDPIAEEFYEYFELGDEVNLIGEGNNMLPSVPYEVLGKESEILSEIRQIKDYTVGGSIGVDVSIGGQVLLIAGVPAFVPMPASTSIKGGGFVNENIYRTHVTSKIITYPVLLKRMINKTDGVTHITENIAFDDNTGEPVVVRSYDDFAGTYLNQAFPAAWNYDNLESKFQNENLKVDGPLTYGTDANGNEFLEFTAANSCDALASFVKGDFIHIDNISGALYHVNTVDLVNNRLYILPSQLYSAAPASIPTTTNGIVSLFVLKSGYTNQLNVKMANIMFFDEDGSLAPYAAAPTLTNNSAFVQALNTVLISYSGGTQIYALSGGPFTNMSISNFATQLPVGCDATDLSDVTIDNVEVTVTETASVMSVFVTSFTTTCAGGVAIDNCDVF